MADDNKTEAETKVPSKKESAVHGKVKEAVDEFVDKHLRNSPFSRNTPAWNHLQERIPLLIEGITQKVEG